MQHDLLFTYDFPPMGGGISRMMETIAKYSPAGSLIVCTGSIPGAEATDKAHHNLVHRVATPSGRLRTIPGRLQWSQEAVDLARNPEARFAWCSSVRPSATPAWWAQQRTGLPYGIILYGGDVLTMRKKLSSPGRRLQVRQAFAGASVVVAISKWTAEQYASLADKLDLPERVRTARVINPGIPVTPPNAPFPDFEALQDERALPWGKWLLTVARLVPHKGIDTGIRAVALLKDAYPSLHYLIIGRGPYEADLRILAAELGVEDRVHIFTDVTDEELPRAYALADIYLGLSRESPMDVEGFGISMLEAGDACLPVVAGASGGIPDAVQHGKTGFLVDPVNLPEITDTINRLLENDALLSDFGLAGQHRVREEFTCELMVERFRHLAQEFGRPA